MAHKRKFFMNKHRVSKETKETFEPIVDTSITDEMIIKSSLEPNVEGPFLSKPSFDDDQVVHHTILSSPILNSETSTSVDTEEILEEEKDV